MMIRNKDAKKIRLENKIENTTEYYTKRDLQDKGYALSFINKLKEYIPCYKYKATDYFLNGNQS